MGHKHFLHNLHLTILKQIKNMKRLLIASSSLISIIALLAMYWWNPSDQLIPENKLNPEFKTHWNDGKAELSSYKLQQARYGEIHEGEATMIFVTEPFSKSKQVKLDDYRNEKDKVNVLKLNAVRKFDTGIYPYSTMTSVFSPIEGNTQFLKTTTSVQEWCGQAFMQINRKGQKLKYVWYSYFESEGDKETTINSALAEDEIWNLIRMNPDVLPQGNIQLVPSSLFLRLKHYQPQVVAATAELKKIKNKEFSPTEIFQYQVTYQQPEQRTLSIFFETAFPHRILGWKEIGRQTTTATLHKSIRLDYWSKHNVADRELKKLLW